MRFYETLWKSTKINESYDILQYFLGKITHFRYISFNYNALLAFCDFVPWQMKFFCLLLYRFTFGRHRQIFCHRQMKGNSPNIADTYQLNDTQLNDTQLNDTQHKSINSIKCRYGECRCTQKWHSLRDWDSLEFANSLKFCNTF
jgi:hypothetical protein